MCKRTLEIHFINGWLFTAIETSDAENPLSGSTEISVFVFLSVNINNPPEVYK